MRCCSCCQEQPTLHLVQQNTHFVTCPGLQLSQLVKCHQVISDNRAVLAKPQLLWTGLLFTVRVSAEKEI